jgi:ubiquitin-protein ligase
MSSSSSKSPSLRRIQADIRELALDPSDRYHATPLENDMFEWHFTIRGAPKTDFDGGVYHGRILLPPEYPFKPPHIIFLTPSGRFETNTKICLSFSAFHPELWQPAWGVRLILEALIAFLPSPADGAIGALDWSSAERKRLAKESVNWSCPHCGKIVDLLPKLKTSVTTTTTTTSGDGENNGESSSSTTVTKSRFQKEIEELQRLQQLEHAEKIDNPEDKGKDKRSIDDTKMPAATSTQQQEEQDHGAEKGDASSAAAAAAASKPAAVATAAVEKVAVETVRLDEALADEGLVANRTTSTTTAAVFTTAAEELFMAANDDDDAAAAAAAGFLAGYNNLNQNQNQIDSNEHNQVLDDNDNNDDDDDMKGSWLSDPVLHVIILILSIICCLLLKKIQALCQDLRNINFD